MILADGDAAPGPQVQKYQYWRNFLALLLQKYKYGRKQHLAHRDRHIKSFKVCVCVWVCVGGGVI
jgi:hypothetical protein